MPTNKNSAPAGPDVSLLPTSFEAKLRGKHKKMFAGSHCPVAAKSQKSEAHPVGHPEDMVTVKVAMQPEAEERSRAQKDAARLNQGETAEAVTSNDEKVETVVKDVGDAEPAYETGDERPGLEIHDEGKRHAETTVIAEDSKGSRNAEDLEISDTESCHSPAGFTTDQKGKWKATDDTPPENVLEEPNEKSADGIAQEQENVAIAHDAENEDDPDEEDDSDYLKNGGDPPSANGWHHFPYIPRGPRLTAILHNGDSEWLDKHRANIPLGIRGPEGYLWGQIPEDLMWAEYAPHVVARTSASQLRYMGVASHVEAFEPGMENVKGAKPLFSGPSNTFGLPVEFFCGKPGPAGYLSYGDPIPGAGVDRLNVYLSFDELPLTLDVFDEDDVTNPDTHNDRDPKEPNFDRTKRLGHPIIPISPGSKALKYRLVDPTGKHMMERKLGEATHATLIISKSRQIGAGHSARVYDGQISLEIKKEPFAPRMRFHPRLRVVTKVGTGPDSEEHMLNEATLYNSFPPHLSQEYTGFQLVTPCHTPYRLSPIVPCFYGFYQPVETKIEGSDSLRSSITLTEDCGSQIDVKMLTQNSKAEIFSLFQRFHNAGFSHQSVFSRNILIQPGSVDDTPLSRNPEWGRSIRTPSFRIIDFGRSVILTDSKDNTSSRPWEPYTSSKTEADRSLMRQDIHQLNHAIKMHILAKA